MFAFPSELPETKPFVISAKSKSIVLVISISPRLSSKTVVNKVHVLFQELTLLSFILFIKNKSDLIGISSTRTYLAE